MPNKTGVLLINLGTPESLSIFALMKYLREFLSDPRVIDIPALLRFILVYLFILPTRPFKAKKAYAAIWDKKGSPLRYLSESATSKLQHSLGEEYVISLAMRYGTPSIKKATENFKYCKKIIVLPLFPQYSSAATGSAAAAAMENLSKLWDMPDIHIINSFYNNHSFIKAYSKSIAEHIKPGSFLLFSYHGLPVRHINKSNCFASCASTDNPCPMVSSENHFCYKAQCYATSRLIASELNIPQELYTTSFQSRLGKTPWIKPYTDDTLLSIRAMGIENLVVACPGFVTDCLETLEEIGMAAKKDWLNAGGTTFTLVPCLNDDEAWINSMADIIKNI